jgi:dihydroorotase-like cyclic amidohydrolase
MAEQTGCRLIIAHVSCAESLDMIAAARQRGVDVFAESCPHFFSFTDEDIKAHGPYLKFSPVMRDLDNLEKMWDYLARGYVHTIGSDHCPYEPEEKVPGETCIWDAPNGVPGLEVMLPVLLTGVAKGYITLERLVEVTSYNAAKIYGLYPQKGTMLPGSDADLVVVDMNLVKTFTKGDIKSKCPYSPYLGMKFKGWPVMTIVRGTVVARDGEICVSPGYGRYYSRNELPGKSPAHEKPRFKFRG